MKFKVFVLSLCIFAGVNMANAQDNRHEIRVSVSDGLTEAGKAAAAKADLNTSFAYQVNPIALRVGNETIGAFVEAGLGHKGFVTAGLSFRF